MYLWVKADENSKITEEKQSNLLIFEAKELLQCKTQNITEVKLGKSDNYSKKLTKINPNQDSQFNHHPGSKKSKET